MTKNQKQNHINSLIDIIESNGFKLDRYGNYKLSTTNHTYRIKVKKINIRIERQALICGKKEWFKLVSNPIVKINPVALNKYLIALKERK
jgi:hypothetical protein